jgi:hypothetical protein
MNPADVFVGAVSAIAGSLGVAAGVGNWEACYQLTKIRWLVNRVGRERARLIYIGGGLFFIALGIAIACGFALHRGGGGNSSERGSRMKESVGSRL